MKKLEEFINANFNYFCEFSDSEVETYTLDEFEDDVVDYLKSIERFDYRGICIYYAKSFDQIWVENMDA